MTNLKNALVAILALCWSVGPIGACINDRDTSRLERQFKSLYPDTDKVTPPGTQLEAVPSRGPLLVYGAPIAGVALLSGAGYLAFTRRIS
jgi:hypothetical protein